MVRLLPLSDHVTDREQGARLAPSERVSCSPLGAGLLGELGPQWLDWWNATLRRRHSRWGVRAVGVVVSGEITGSGGLSAGVSMWRRYPRR